ncbi:hypothetical protein BH24ACT15_BH24ACT15_20760 [soil metagenome]
MSADEEFLGHMAALLGTPSLSSQERATVLDLTRVIAHSTERRFGPLTVYALGLSMAASMPPQDRAERLQRAIDAIESGQDPESSQEPNV